MRIACFGPGPQFKGGISNYNLSLAKALDKIPDVEVFIISWTQQYPAIIPRDFKDKKSKKDLLEGTKIKVEYITNYNNPITWAKTVDLIRNLEIELIIFQWSIAIQGLPISYIASKLNYFGIPVAFDLHFVIQKEQSSIDRMFTKMALKHGDFFITHALTTYEELKQLFPSKSFERYQPNRHHHGSIDVINLYHPVYDMFSPLDEFDVTSFKKEHGLKRHVFLFFGFIRKYKGLHNVIPAFKLLTDRRDDVSLLICGESFWQTLDQKKWTTQIKNKLFKIAKSVFVRKSDNEQDYQPLSLINTLGLKDEVVVFNEFIPNEDVHKYFQVSDAVLLFYDYATPSGVESIGYNFKMPILATKVGHFPETVHDGFNGYLAKPDNIEDMARIMELFIQSPIDRHNVELTTQNMSWEHYARTIYNYVIQKNKN